MSAATNRLVQKLEALVEQLQPLKAEHETRVQRALAAMKTLRDIRGKGVEPTRTEAEWHANGGSHDAEWRDDLREKARNALHDWLTEQGFYS